MARIDRMELALSKIPSIHAILLILLILSKYNRPRRPWKCRSRNRG